MKQPAFGWKSVATVIAALAGSAYSVYKVYRFDENLSRIELQQKGIELLQARDAVMKFDFGEATVVARRGPVTGTWSRYSRAPSQTAEFVIVTVPVTIKNLSRLPIAIDFSEQWVFVGRLMGPGKGPLAEVLNTSIDAYPIAWKRAHCTVGVSWGALTNLNLRNALLAEGKADLLNKHGPEYWAASAPAGNAEEARDLLRAAAPTGEDGRAQLAQLRIIVGRRLYFDHTQVGASCGATTQGLWTGTLRGGEESTVRAMYVVRATEGWFSHFVRLHYRQVHDGADAGTCRTDLLARVQTALDKLELGLEICSHPRRARAGDFHYLEKRDVLYLPAVLEKQERAERGK